MYILMSSAIFAITFRETSLVKNNSFYFNDEQSFKSFTILKKTQPITILLSIAVLLNLQRKKVSEFKNKALQSESRSLSLSELLLSSLQPVPVAFHIIMKVMRQDGSIIPCPFSLPGDTISDASPKTSMKFCSEVLSCRATISTHPQKLHIPIEHLDSLTEHFSNRKNINWKIYKHKVVIANLFTVCREL